MTIIIPSARNENLDECLDAIERLDRNRLRDVVVMDTGLNITPGNVRVCQALLGAEFNFAQTINCAMELHRDDHYVVLNDDAILQTPAGLSLLWDAFSRTRLNNPRLGVLSSCVQGVACNPNLFPEDPPIEPPFIRWERNMVPFICTMISRECIEYTGRLDERFTGYGCEDTDFCHRAKMAGFDIGIWSGCTVEHESVLSTFRSQEGWSELYDRNKNLFHKKWKTPHMGLEPPTGDIDILFLSHNRYGYTEEALRCLTRNTDWSRVGKVFFWDDSSTDGTLELVRDKSSIIGLSVPFEVSKHEFRNSVSPLRRFIRESNAPFLVKLDNDTCVPPMWLNRCMDVLDRNPDIGLLGLEPAAGYITDPIQRRGWTSAKHIGGIGVFRRRCFETADPDLLDLPCLVARSKYSGWTEWQHQHPQIVKAWLEPGIPVVLLDRVPSGSWREMGKQYVIEGWQREWEKYEEGEAVYQWL